MKFLYGDVYVEFGNRGFVSKIINFFQKIYHRTFYGKESAKIWNVPHCGIIIDDYTTFEAARDGVKYYKWKKPIHKKKKVAVYRANFTFDAKKQAMLLLVTNVNNTSYGYAQLLSFVIATAIRNYTGHAIKAPFDDGLVCAELVFLFLWILSCQSGSNKMQAYLRRFLITTKPQDLPTPNSEDVSFSANEIDVITILSICKNQQFFKEVYDGRKK